MLVVIATTERLPWHQLSDQKKGLGRRGRGLPFSATGLTTDRRRVNARIQKIAYPELCLDGHTKIQDPPGPWDERLERLLT